MIRFCDADHTSQVTPFPTPRPSLGHNETINADEVTAQENTTMTTIALKLNTAVRPQKTARIARRSLAQCLELVGVLALMGSSAAYALFTLAHLA